MSVYTELKQRHSREVNDLPFFFAFNDKQFEAGMQKFGLTVEQTDQIYKFGSIGGFYRRSDSAKIHGTLERHEKEREEAIAADKKGDGYIFEMFLYELNNHEYGYTWDVTDTLNALDLTPEQIAGNKALKHGFTKAVKRVKAGKRRRK